MAKILLIDDDPDILRLGSKVLTLENHDVVLAKDAHAAFDYLRNFEFDLVISDANMPKMSGFDLVKSLRANPQLKHLAIALLTARRERKDIETAIGLGVDDYILKPIDPLLLSKKVDSLLRKNKPESQTLEGFKGAKVSSIGAIQLLIQINHISELGLEVTSNHPLHEGASFEIKTSLFEEIGIRPPLMRVVTSEIISPDQWNLRIHFVGTDEGALQRIRAWINTKLIRQHTRAA